jgi:flagellar biosynthesis protein FliR
MKKYKNIYDTLLSLTFINNQEYIIETIYFLQLYFFNKKNIKLKTMTIYILYSYVNINLNNLIKSIEFINNITNKSTDFIDSILLIKMPKNIKNLIINKINDTVKKINNN